MDGTWKWKSKGMSERKGHADGGGGSDTPSVYVGVCGRGQRPHQQCITKRRNRRLEGDGGIGEEGGGER